MSLALMIFLFLVFASTARMILGELGPFFMETLGLSQTLVVYGHLVIYICCMVVASSSGKKIALKLSQKF